MTVGTLAMTQQTATNNIMSERGVFMWTLNCLYYRAQKYFRSMSSGVQNIELEKVVLNQSNLQGMMICIVVTGQLGLVVIFGSQFNDSRNSLNTIIINIQVYKL
jgi:hypothetical protein